MSAIALVVPIQALYVHLPVPPYPWPCPPHPNLYLSSHSSAYWLSYLYFHLRSPWAFLPISTFVLTAVFLRSSGVDPGSSRDCVQRCFPMLSGALDALDSKSPDIFGFGGRETEQGGENEVWYAQLQTAAVHMCFGKRLGLLHSTYTCQRA